MKNNEKKYRNLSFSIAVIFSVISLTAGFSRAQDSTPQLKLKTFIGVPGGLLLWMTLKAAPYGQIVDECAAGNRPKASISMTTEGALVTCAADGSGIVTTVTGIWEVVNNNVVLSSTLEADSGQVPYVGINTAGDPLTPLHVEGNLLIHQDGALSQTKLNIPQGQSLYFDAKSGATFIGRDENASAGALWTKQGMLSFNQGEGNTTDNYLATALGALRTNITGSQSMGIGTADSAIAGNNNVLINTYGVTADATVIDSTIIGRHRLSSDAAHTLSGRDNEVMVFTDKLTVNVDNTDTTSTGAVLHANGAIGLTGWDNNNYFTTQSKSSNVTFSGGYINTNTGSYTSFGNYHSNTTDGTAGKRTVNLQNPAIFPGLCAYPPVVTLTALSATFPAIVQLTAVSGSSFTFQVYDSTLRPPTPADATVHYSVACQPQVTLLEYIISPEVLQLGK